MTGTLPQLDSKIVKATLGAILYTLIMAIGMFVMHTGFNLAYSQPEMVYVIGVTEIGLTLVVVFMVQHSFSWKEIGFQKLQINQFAWFVPHLLIIAVMGFVFFYDITQNWGQLSFAQQRLIVVIGLTTLLVGISEEVMYRGIILHSISLAKRRIYGVLFSSIVFSLLHAVNIFGGQSVEAVNLQLVNTFLLGFCFANFALRFKNIIPLIIFHWLWDFILIGSVVIGSEAGEFGVFAFPMNIVLGFTMWVTYKPIT